MMHAADAAALEAAIIVISSVSKMNAIETAARKTPM
jgi:hypothetical protein